jgi:hypothetical protein
MKKTARNDITGDFISKSNLITNMFEKNFDLIFREKERSITRV